MFLFESHDGAHYMAPGQSPFSTRVTFYTVTFAPLLHNSPSDFFNKITDPQLQKKPSSRHSIKKKEKRTKYPDTKRNKKSGIL